MTRSLVAGLLLALSALAGAAQDMKPPRLSAATVDWAAALAALASNEALRPLPDLARLNAAMSQRFPGVAKSPVPVLLPFDVDALLRDQADSNAAAAGNERYLSGFHARTFFFPGPSGYDGAFAIRPAEIAELSDIKFGEPYEIHISGSALLYELDDSPSIAGTPAPALEPDFPGIRRLLHEHHLRFTFVRFGVPYVVSIGCFDGSVARYRLPTCKSAERVAIRFLHALRVVGGTPQVGRALEPLPIERPDGLSPTFTYHAPGRLLPGTGFRGLEGRADTTVYAPIRFPVADAPAFVNSQMFQRRNKALTPGHSPNYSYPWRDNFCERRGFPVGQCPAGAGHQGQDIRGPQCEIEPGANRCRPHHNLVAVRDGAILRAPRQEALYLVVNTAREHLRFRYLHMNPRKMDENNLLSGRLVHEGELIGQIGNFDKREAGTSYHLHFDVQVPTRDGWVFVNPYMTLIAAYERLIGGRGEQTSDPTVVAAADAGAAAVVTPIPRAKPQAAKTSRAAKRVSHKHTKHNNKRKKHRVARG